MYDTAEVVYRELRDHHHGFEVPFQEGINDILGEQGIPWVMVDGIFEFSGDEAETALLHDALDTVSRTDLGIAKQELKDSVACLSRRPEPDLSGAVSHAMSSLESIARHITGDKNATLGAIVDKHDSLFPKPLDQAIQRLWGYASNEARHGREDRNLDEPTARMVVGIVAAMVGYLAEKELGKSE